MSIPNQTRNLPCQLTEDELAKKGHELAIAVRERLDVMATKKKVAKKHSDRIKEYEVTIADVATVIETKSELRVVSVQSFADLRRNVLTTKRLDTDEMIDERTLTASELERAAQIEMEFGPKAKKAGQAFEFVPDPDLEPDSDTAH